MSTQQHKQSKRARWSRRAGLALTSVYWEVPEDDIERFLDLHDNEYMPLKEALQASKRYDDLSPKMRAIFDRAEKAQADYDKALAGDADGFGRICETITYPNRSDHPPPTDEESISASLGLNKGEKYFRSPPGEGWVQMRPGPLGGHVYKKLAVTDKPKPLPPSPPREHVAPSAIDPEHVAKGYQIVKGLAGKENLAPMAKVRAALSEANITDHAQQDAVINELRRVGRVSASALEGRHGASEDDLRHAMREGESLLGFLSVKK